MERNYFDESQTLMLILRHLGLDPYYTDIFMDLHYTIKNFQKVSCSDQDLADYQSLFMRLLNKINDEIEENPDLDFLTRDDLKRICLRIQDLHRPR